MKRLTAAAAFALLAFKPAGAAAEEVVVTASKLGDTSRQATPIALDAFNASELSAQNTITLADLSYTMPNVQMEDLGTARGIANISIRGIGVNSSIASVDPAVGVFTDGIYLAMNAGTLTDLFDVSTVEVLRGAQGTLYGHNVTGGAVLVRTREPGDTFEAYGRLRMESGPATTLEGALSGPLMAGKLAGRIAFVVGRDDGWFKNRFDGSKFGASSRYALRTSLKLTLTGFDALLRAAHGQQNGDGPAGQNHALFARGSFDFSIDNRGRAATDFTEASLETHAAVGGGTLTGIFGWRSVTVPWAADIDSTPAFVFHTRVLNRESQHSGEVRYAAEWGAGSMVAGLSAFDESILYVDERNFSPSFRRTGGGQGYFQNFDAFADATWRATENISLHAGLRFSHERKHSRISRVRRAADNLDGAAAVPGEGVAGGDFDAKTLAFSDAPFFQAWDEFSPHIGLSWTPDPRTNLYANWSRAVRAGGANFRTSSLGIQPLAYGPETVDAIEIGLKRQFEKGRIEIALFHNRIGAMQRETNLADPISGVQQLVLNAGNAATYGGEIEARWDVSERWSAAANAGYVNGSYSRVTADLNGDLAVTDADRRMHIPRLAPLSAGLDVFYTAPIADGRLHARAGYRHRDGSFYNDTNLGRLAAADLFDVRISFTPEPSGFSVALYGRNLSNVATWGGDTTLPSTSPFGYAGKERPTFSPLAKGRSFGLEIGWTN